MKTLLMTAIAAVFALQVQAAPSSEANMIPSEIGSFTDPQLSSMINWEARLRALDQLNTLNSSPKLDSLISTNSKVFFEYDSAGNISIITKQTKSGLKEKWAYKYEESKFKSIAHHYESSLSEVFAFSYDDSGHLSNILSKWDDKKQTEFEFNPEGTLKKITHHGLISATYNVPTATSFEYDSNGRLIKQLSFNYETQYIGGGSVTAVIDGNCILNRTTIIDYAYTEPSGGQPYFIKEVSEKYLDSVIPNLGSTTPTSALTSYRVLKFKSRGDSCITTCLVDSTKGNLYINTTARIYDDNGLLVESTDLFKNLYENTKSISTVYRYTYSDGLLIKSPDGTTFFYRTAPLAKSLNLNNNKTITITFNYPLDATADVKSMLAIREPALKADLSALAIQRAYVNPTNAKELVIELNRPLEVREGFELYSTQDLPLKDGRFVPVSLVAQGGAATGAEQNAAGEVSVTVENNIVTVSAPQGIASAAVYSIAGMLVATVDGANASEAIISAGSLSAGLYYVQVTDGLGNASVHQVAIGK